jgi:hypothetical protein
LCDTVCWLSTEWCVRASKEFLSHYSIQMSQHTRPMRIPQTWEASCCSKVKKWSFCSVIYLVLACVAFGILYFRIKVRACAKTRNCDAAVNREFVSARLPVRCVISSQLGQSKDGYCFFRPSQLEIKQVKKVGRKTFVIRYVHLKQAEY